MAGYTKRSHFIDTEEGRAAKQKLQFMAGDEKYNTQSSYSANSSQHPDNLISFVDKHMNYLNVHPKLDAKMYLANLQLMTLVR